jgi:hypothetical protein
VEAIIGKNASVEKAIVEAIATFACHDDGRCSRVRQRQRHGSAARSAERIGTAGADRSPTTACAAFLSTFQCGASRADRMSAVDAEQNKLDQRTGQEVEHLPLLITQNERQI